MSAERSFAVRPSTRPSTLRSALAIVRLGVAESLRRRVFLVVFALTVAFLALYGLGTAFAFRETRESFGGLGGVPIDELALVGSTLFGLAMFAILFLGGVLAVFLTIGVVRGDAESGLLQPLVVRPLGRGTMLVARFLGAAAAAALYVIAVFAAAWLIMELLGDWSPSNVIGPCLALAFGVIILAALSVLGSTILAGSAQGIAVFMIFGAGLTAGLLGQIGDGINSDTLVRISDIATWVLPFEALYQAGLYALTSDLQGFEQVIVQLGPFGGAESAGPDLVIYSLVYTAAVIAAAVAIFARRDL